MIDAILAINLQARQLCTVDLQTRHQLECYPIAIGAEATPTPIGKFEVTRLVNNPQYVSCQTNINHGSGFLGDFAIVTNLDTSVENCKFAIHGTPERLEHLIGEDVTGGCNRMRNKDINHLNTNYIIHGGFIEG